MFDLSGCRNRVKPSKTSKEKLLDYPFEKRQRHELDMEFATNYS